MAIIAAKFFDGALARGRSNRSVAWPLALVMALTLVACASEEEDSSAGDAIPPVTVPDDPQPGDDGPRTGGTCGEPAESIAQIQGNGLVSPLLDQKVTIEATVTANFQPGLSGVFVQDEVRPDTGHSSGLFLYFGEQTHEIQPGDRIRATGTVREHGDTPDSLTQLSGISALEKCAELDVPSPLILAENPDARVREAHEGMLVQLSDDWRVTGHGELARFGSVILHPHERLLAPTQLLEPGNDLIAVMDDVAERIIYLDDGSAASFPRLHPFPLSATETLRLGDRVISPIGILDQRFGAWRIQPVGPVAVVPENPRPSSPPRIVGNLHVAGFNLGNYFNGAGGRFSQGRGARNSVEFERQTQKLSAALSLMPADIIAVMELENDGFGSESAVNTLVSAVNDRNPNANLAFVDAGVGRLGWDVITVGILFRSDRVKPVGSPATLNSEAFQSKNRAPLAQSFEHLESGEVITVISVHLKSKGGCEMATGADGDNGQGQGCWNLTRRQAAEQLARWAQNKPTDADQGNVLVIGDFNAYRMEQPINAMSEAGMMPVSLGSRGYTINWGAFSGAVDHAFASPALMKKVRSSAIWHINADEPSLLDFSLARRSTTQANLYYSPGPVRSSDHDPILVGFELGDSE